VRQQQVPGAVSSASAVVVAAARTAPGSAVNVTASAGPAGTRQQQRKEVPVFLGCGLDDYVSSSSSNTAAAGGSSKGRGGSVQPPSWLGWLLPHARAAVAKEGARKLPKVGGSWQLRGRGRPGGGELYDFLGVGLGL